MRRVILLAGIFFLVACNSALAIELTPHEEEAWKEALGKLACRYATPTSKSTRAIENGTSAVKELLEWGEAEPEDTELAKDEIEWISDAKCVVGGLKEFFPRELLEPTAGLGAFQIAGAIALGAYDTELIYMGWTKTVDVPKDHHTTEITYTTDEKYSGSSDYYEQEHVCFPEFHGIPEHCETRYLERHDGPPIATGEQYNCEIAGGFHTYASEACVIPHGEPEAGKNWSVVPSPGHPIFGYLAHFHYEEGGIGGPKRIKNEFPEKTGIMELCNGPGEGSGEGCSFTGTPPHPVKTWVEYPSACQESIEVPAKEAEEGLVNTSEETIGSVCKAYADVVTEGKEELVFSLTSRPAFFFEPHGYALMLEGETLTPHPLTRIKPPGPSNEVALSGPEPSVGGPELPECIKRILKGLPAGTCEISLHCGELCEIGVIPIHLKKEPVLFDPPGLPEVKFPESEVNPCEYFPFGLPCWLYEIYEKTEAESEAPHFSYSVDGVAGEINLSKLSPVMEYIRAALIVLSAIGFMMFLYRVSQSGDTDDG